MTEGLNGGSCGVSAHRLKSTSRQSGERTRMQFRVALVLQETDELDHGMSTQGERMRLLGFLVLNIAS